MGECAHTWANVPIHGRMCPYMGGCAHIWADVPIYGRMLNVERELIMTGREAVEI